MAGDETWYTCKLCGCESLGAVHYPQCPAHPDNNENVGARFRGWNGNTYKCESLDDCGYWMVNEADASDRRNVSTRAIGGAFRRIPA